MAKATLANTCSGIITEITFLSLEDKNGLINIHPDAKRTIIKKLLNTYDADQFIQNYAPIINKLRIPLMLSEKIKNVSGHQ
jgi:hypothetical protein